MSTRAQIVIKDAHDSLIFYRHSDGYPDGTMPTLERFLEHVKAGEIRDNVGQAAGWLILIGAEEYLDNTWPGSGMEWKAGAYEPATCLHSDIEYLYVIDLVSLTITVHDSGFEDVYNNLKEAA